MGRNLVRSISLSSIQLSNIIKNFVGYLVLKFCFVARPQPSIKVNVIKCNIKMLTF